MKIKSLLIVLISFLLFGCAATQQLNEATRKEIQTIYIDKNVEKPAKMYYLGPGGAIGLMFGAVGGALTAAANAEPGEELKKFAEQNNILPNTIISEEIEAVLAKSGKLQLVAADSPNAAKFKISILQYGFSIPNGFSSSLVPAFFVKCSIVDKSGKTVWESSSRVSLLSSPSEPITLAEVKANPKVMETSWRSAAKQIAAEIVQGM